MELGVIYTSTIINNQDIILPFDNGNLRYLVVKILNDSVYEVQCLNNQILLVIKVSLGDLSGLNDDFQLHLNNHKRFVELGIPIYKYQSISLLAESWTDR